MADHHTHRPRILATPDPNPDPTLKRQSNHKSKSAHPDQTRFSATMSNHLSRLNLYSHRSQKPSNPRALDTRLQGRAMTVSVDAADLSSSIKPHKSRRAKDEAKERDKLREELVRCQKSVKQKGDAGKNVEEKQPAAVGVPVGGRRRRRSFSGSQVELDDVFASCGAKIVAVDMPPFMQIHAVDCARRTHDSLEKFTAKALALTLKREFDGVYGPAWHCIVGKSFGSFVTHSVGGFLYFSMDHKLYILLFKTTVQRAD